jgi:ParB/RepB/Spo0J family partition protein
MANRKETRGDTASLASLVASATLEAESAAGEPRTGTADDPRQRSQARSVPLSRIRVREGHNPRTQFDGDSIRRMAETIASNGILQPLVVEPASNGAESLHYYLLHGERRLRSLRHLVQVGHLVEDEPVPVFIRGELDEEERLTSALVENLQREELDPLDEAEGFRKLRDVHGRSTAQIAQAVGRSQRHVQFRLQLLTLEEGVRDWIREGGISAVSARVIAGTPPSLQEAAIEYFRGQPDRRATEQALREWLRHRMIPFERALFDPDSYRGAGGEVWATDTGARDPGDRGRYFTDLVLFERLQREAIRQTKRDLAARFDWVRETVGSDLPGTLERDPDGPGAVILLRRGIHEIEVIEGVRDAEADDPALLEGLERIRATDRQDRQPLLFPEPPSKERLRRAERLRSRALQGAIVRDRDAVLRLAVVGLLAAGWSPGRDGNDRFDLAPVVEEALTGLAYAAGKVSVDELVAPEEPSESRRARREDLYLRLVPVRKKELDRAFRALVAATVAGWTGRSAPRLESPRLACRVAEDLQVTVDDWQPTSEYFREYPRAELEALARQLGFEAPADWTQEELIEALLEALPDADYTPPELAFWDGRDAGAGGSS